LNRRRIAGFALSAEDAEIDEHLARHIRKYLGVK